MLSSSQSIQSTTEQLQSSKSEIVQEIEDIKSQTASAATDTGQQGPVRPSGDGQINGDDERAKAESAAQWMRYHQERADRNFAELMKNHEMLGTLMVRMTQLDLNRIEFEEVLTIIRQSLVILDQVQVQWSMLTQFFMAMAVRTETAVSRMINPFLATIDDLPQGFASEADREITLEVLQSFIPDIEMAAHFLHSLSKTYVQVSSKYILNQLAGMTGLSVLPMEQRRPKMNELAEKSKAAEQEIFQMVKEKRIAYGSQVASQVVLPQNGLGWCIRLSLMHHPSSFSGSPFQ